MENINQANVEKKRQWIEENIHKNQEYRDNNKLKYALTSICKVLDVAQDVYTFSGLKTDRENLFLCNLAYAKTNQMLYNKEKDITYLNSAILYYKKTLRLREEEKEINIVSKRQIFELIIQLGELNAVDPKSEIDMKLEEAYRKSVKFYRETKRNDDLKLHIVVSILYGDSLLRNKKVSNAIKVYLGTIKHLEKVYVQLHNGEVEQDLSQLYKKTIDAMQDKKYKKLRIKIEDKLYHILNYN